MSTSDFDTADFYDCRDNEQLTHETPAEAIEDFLDHNAEPGCDYAALIREHAPVTVKAHRRAVVRESFIDAQARDCAERAAEAFSDEFGNPDGDDDGMDADAFKDALPLFRQAVVQLYEHANVWTCEPCGRR